MLTNCSDRSSGGVVTRNVRRRAFYRRCREKQRIVRRSYTRNTTSAAAAEVLPARRTDGRAAPLLMYSARQMSDDRRPVAQARARAQTAEDIPHGRLAVVQDRPARSRIYAKAPRAPRSKPDVGEWSWFEPTRQPEAGTFYNRCWRERLRDGQWRRGSTKCSAWRRHPMAHHSRPGAPAAWQPYVRVTCKGRRGEAQPTAARSSTARWKAGRRLDRAKDGAAGRSSPSLVQPAVQRRAGEDRAEREEAAKREPRRRSGTKSRTASGRSPNRAAKAAEKSRSLRRKAPTAEVDEGAREFWSA